MKYTNKILAWIMLSWMLVSCTNKAVEVSDWSNEQTWIQSNDNTWINSTQDVEAKKLSINEKCIWCGHCVRSAPNNISMSWHKAIVISQENIWSLDVSNAINVCPVDAIEVW